MVRTLIGIFLTIPILTLTAEASNYLITLAESIVGAEHFAHIDPLMGANNDVEGWVFSDYGGSRLIVDFVGNGADRMIPLEGRPVKSIHAFSADRDTLKILVLHNDQSFEPAITLIKITEFGESAVSFTPALNRGYGYPVAIVSQDIRFQTDVGGSVSSIWFEANIRFQEDLGSAGPAQEDIPTSILLSLDLDLELARLSATSARLGYLSGYDDRVFCSFDDYFYSIGPVDVGINTSDNQYRHTTVSFETESGVPLLQTASRGGDSYRLMIGDFSSELPFEELIYQGHGRDLLNQRAGAHDFVACYGFADGLAEELWYTDSPDADFRFAYSSGHSLVGLRDSDRVVFLDYLNGELTDSVFLNRDLDAVTFFESGTDPTSLHLVGRSYDTVFVYRFDRASHFWQAADDALLTATFTLFQNHPNPFNNETEIRVDCEETQQLSLKIYNILGQEVAVLIDRVVPPGTHYASWDGMDSQGMSQSSGIYFARVQAESYSQMIKLILVK